MAEPRNLATYARWVLAQSYGTLPPPAVPPAVITDATGAVTRLLLHRAPPYQTELFVFHPRPGGSTAPTHRHPDVDSMEVYLAGDIAFVVNGHPVRLADYAHRPGHDGRPLMLRVRARDWHGATIGPAGGAFLSLQRWLHGVPPSSVAANWDGAPHVAHTALP